MLRLMETEEPSSAVSSIRSASKDFRLLAGVQTAVLSEGSGDVSILAEGRRPLSLHGEDECVALSARAAFVPPSAHYACRVRLSSR